MAFFVSLSARNRKLFVEHRIFLRLKQSFGWIFTLRINPHNRMIRVTRLTNQPPIFGFQTKWYRCHCLCSMCCVTSCSVQIDSLRLTETRIPRVILFRLLFIFVHLIRCLLFGVCVCASARNPFCELKSGKTLVVLNAIIVKSYVECCCRRHSVRVVITFHFRLFVYLTRSR